MSCQETICALISGTNYNFTNNTVNLTNVESEKPGERWFIFNVIIITFQVMADFLIFFGNLLVIIAVATTKGLRRVTDLYIVSLAIADLLVSVLVLPLSIMRQVFGYWPYESHVLCLIWLSFNVFLCSASILNLCCISMDRYIAIAYPMKYISKRTRRTALIMIGGAWTLSFLVTLPPIFGMQHHTGVGSCYIRSDTGYRFLTGIVSFIIPFLLVGFIYVRIFWVIRQRSKEFEMGKFSADLKERKQGSLNFLFSRNRICADHVGRVEQSFSSCYSNQHRMFMLRDRRFNVCISRTPNDKQEQFKVVTYKPYDQNKPERVQSVLNELQTSKHCAESVQMIQNPFQQHKTLRSNVNLLSNLMSHVRRVSSETHTSQAIDTKTSKFSGESLCTVDNTDRLIFTMEQKTVKTVAVVVCCFILCWLPFATIHLGKGVCECLLSEEITMATSWVAYLNSMCNPIIYAFCNKEYAKAFVRLLRIGSNI
ncbi:D(2) dopamine receptor A [Schistosoma japonicum]|uniref:D(2) dopamine receptor A n=1 Tax=Schistosoma japonicum TaxID=6182 RepID=A0A4Z2DP87_SCHJA|nr:D(2) dopamine receptor A [Schistosoma japonicum]